MNVFLVLLTPIVNSVAVRDISTDHNVFYATEIQTLGIVINAIMSIVLDVRMVGFCKVIFVLNVIVNV